MNSLVDGYGFDRSKDPQAAAYDEFMADYLSILARRASRWSHMLSSGAVIAKSRKGQADHAYFQKIFFYIAFFKVISVALY